MSVTDPIKLGKLRLIPKEFQGHYVAVELEADGEALEDGQLTVSVVRDVKAGLPPFVNGPPEPSVPLLPIKVWESLQEVSAWIARAQLAARPEA